MRPSSLPVEGAQGGHRALRPWRFGRRRAAHRGRGSPGEHRWPPSPAGAGERRLSPRAVRRRSEVSPSISARSAQAVGPSADLTGLRQQNLGQDLCTEVLGFVGIAPQSTGPGDPRPSSRPAPRDDPLVVQLHLRLPRRRGRARAVSSVRGRGGRAHCGPASSLRPASASPAAVADSSSGVSRTRSALTSTTIPSCCSTARTRHSDPPPPASCCTSA